MQNAKIFVFLLEDFGTQREILNLLNTEKRIEKNFVNKFLEIYLNKSKFTEFLDESKNIEIKKKLSETTNYIVKSKKLYFEFNPIYYKKILEIKKTYEILEINDDDLLSYFSKVNILDSKENTILQRFTVLIDSLIELRKEVNIRIENIGHFQNKDSEKKQIKKASKTLENYAKVTGNVKMMKCLVNIPHFWQTKNDIIKFYEKYLYEFFKQFYSNVSNENYDLLAKTFSESLSFKIK